MNAYKGQSTIPLLAEDIPVESFRWTRTGGPAITVKCQGSYDACYGIGQNMVDDFDVIEINRQPGSEWCILTASQNGDDVQEIHEVTGNHLTQNKWLNPVVVNRFLGEGMTLANYQKMAAELARKIQTFKGNDTATAVIDTLISDCNGIANGLGWTGPATDTVENIVKDIVANGDFYVTTQYVYRHTYQYADRIWKDLDTSSYFKNVNRIHTEGQLRAVEIVPTGFWLPKQMIDDTTGAQWLKCAPNAALAIGQKRSVVIEYLWADTWNAVHYLNAVT